MTGLRRPLPKMFGNVRAMLVVVCYLSLDATTAMKNPCHPAAHKATPAYGCTKIVLPKGLCTQCNVAPFTDRGHYVDCTKTTTVEKPQCISKFEEYLAMNPCDTTRKAAYEQYKSPNPLDREEGRSKIDYYLYSVCEQSCDCLPLQSSKIHREVEIRRGNCQAHTRYDVCKVLPNVRLIRGEGSPDDDVSKAPRICEGITAWWNSPDRDNWQNRQDHKVSPAVAYFLHRAIQASEMVTSDAFWNKCFELETSQDRISDNNDGWQVVRTDGIPDGRHESCFVWHQGKAYLIGGRGKPLVSVYDPRIKKWSNHSSTSARDIHHSQCVSLNGKIWFPNAWTKGFPNEENVATMATYDPETQKWDTQTHPALPSRRRRGAGASVVYNGKIYTSHGNSGGHNNKAQLLSLLDVYNPETRRWSALRSGAYARDHTGGAVVRDPDGHDLFCVAGGRDSTHGFPKSYGEYVTRTECYNFKTKQWETKRNIPTPRAGANYGTTCDRKLMVAGGEILGDGNQHPALSVVEVFDGVKWTKEPSLNQGRHGSGIAFDCSPCGEAHIASGNPTRGGGRDLVTTETFFREGVKCSRPLEQAPTASPAPPTYARISQPTSTTTAPAFSLFINSGRTKTPTVRDDLGRGWVSDRDFVGGTVTFRNAVKNVANAETGNMLDIYRSGRSSEQSFQYKLKKLQAGNYKVTLHFAETLRGQTKGRRLFNVDAQGKTILNNFDIFAEANGISKAVVKDFIVVVNGAGTIDLKFRKGKRGNPYVSGIQVESLFEATPSDSLYSKFISCGGVGTVTDGSGRSWEQDNEYVGQGRVYRPLFPKSIENTDATGMNPVYKTQRTHVQRIPYEFRNIPNAYYTVTLHFIEQVAALSDAGKRRFHIDIQGKREETNYDIYSDAGGRHKAVRKTFFAKVTGHELQIELLKGNANSPIISAIQLQQMPPDFQPPVATPPPPPVLFTVRLSMGTDTTFSNQGTRWVSDGRFVPNTVKKTRNTSARTIDRLPEGANKEVMRTYRSRAGTWTISLPRLPQGRVRMQLFWAELDPQFSDVGKRSFHVNIQGKRVLTGFDVRKAAGAPFRTVTREFPAVIGSDGLIKVDMIKGPAGDPFLSALLITSEPESRRVLLASNTNETIATTPTMLDEPLPMPALYADEVSL